jgi:hypothetical protein
MEPKEQPLFVPAMLRLSLWLSLAAWILIGFLYLGSRLALTTGLGELYKRNGSSLALAVLTWPVFYGICLFGSFLLVTLNRNYQADRAHKSDTFQQMHVRMSAQFPLFINVSVVLIPGIVILGVSISIVLGLLGLLNE